MIALNILYDITVPLMASTLVFPGDPLFQVETVSSLASGDTFGLCRLNFGNHTGTHIDFPAHVIPGGKTSSDYPANHFISDGMVLHIQDDVRVINNQVLQARERDIREGEVVLFRTTNSKLWETQKFVEDYVHVDRSAAEYLKRRKVKMVGIDYISIDAYAATTLPVHKLLLSSGILILEGLNLTDVPEGRYTIFALPLNVPGMDGLPARVILSPQKA